MLSAVKCTLVQSSWLTFFQVLLTVVANFPICLENYTSFKTNSKYLVRNPVQAAFRSYSTQKVKTNYIKFSVSGGAGGAGGEGGAGGTGGEGGAGGAGGAGRIGMTKSVRLKTGNTILGGS